MAAKRKKKAVDDRERTHAAALRNTRLLVVLLCIALSALAVVPFFFMGSSEEGDQGLALRMPVTHDMFLQYDQMRSFYNGLAAGEIYPRWEEDTNRGFGAATTIYYPPGVYYLTSAFVCGHGRLASDAPGRTSVDDDRFGGGAVSLRSRGYGPAGGRGCDGGIHFSAVPHC